MFTVSDGNSSSEKEESIYTATLPNNALVSIIVSVFSEDSEVLFANQTISVCAKFFYIIIVSNLTSLFLDCC